MEEINSNWLGYEPCHMHQRLRRIPTNNDKQGCLAGQRWLMPCQRLNFHYSSNQFIAPECTAPWQFLSGPVCIEFHNLKYLKAERTVVVMVLALTQYLSNSFENKHQPKILESEADT